MSETLAARAPQVLLRLQMVVVATWTIFALLNGSMGRPRSASIDVALTLVSLAFVAATVLRPARWRLSFHSTMATTCAALVVLSWWSGGAHAVAWWYLAPAPLFAAHIAGQRAGVFWTVCCALGALASMLLSFGEVEFLPTLLDRSVGGVCLVVVCASLGLLARSVADEQLEQIHKAAKARADLLATIGHEVRTPLHGMVGTASILAETKLAPEQREMLATIRSSGGALRKIVDDVLDVARLDAGRLGIDPHPVDLCTVVEDVVDLFAGDASTRGVGLFAVAPSSVTVEVDGMRVRQILANLVGNAVKFTEEGHIVVRLEAHAVAGRLAVQIAVEDTGPGVDVEKLGALFTAFQQPDARLARLHGGSGLGLSLSQHLAERMGGTLTADTDREVGARFVLRLEVPASGELEPLPPPPGSSLVLEVEPLLEESHLATAAALGTELSVVASVEALIEAARERPPQVVLVSDSPLLDVGEAVHQLRLALGPALPIVHLLPPVQLGGELPFAELFHGTTLKPLRRSRLRALYEEARLTRDSTPVARFEGNAIVLDDDPTSRRIMTMFLERRGFSVAPLEDGVEAMETLLAERVDLMLCDLHMPEIDGIEVIRRASAMSMTKDTVFAMVTASTLAEDRQRALAAGAHVFLTKPFEPSRIDELVALVRHRASGAPESERPEPSVAPMLEVASDDGALIDPVAFEQMRELLQEEHSELYDDLHEQGRKHLATLRSSSDITELERAAHTLASATLQAAFVAVGERARRLELSMRETSEDDRRAEIEALDRLLAASFVEIGRRDSRPPPISSVPPKPGPAQVRFAGHLTAPFVQRELGRLARSGRPVTHLLVECTAMTSYDPSARRVFEQWMRGIALERVAIVTRNRLWVAVVRAMGVATGRSMRAFRNEDEALAWLGTPDDHDRP